MSRAPRMSIRVAPSLGSIVLVALLTGCGGGGGQIPAPLAVSARTPEGLTAMLSQDRAAVSTGDTVLYTLTIKNTTAAAVSYRGETYDTTGPGIFPGTLAVYDAGGYGVYPGAVGAPPPPTGPLAITVTLQPGQSSSIAHRVSASQLSPSMQSGQYHAVATFSTSDTRTATPPLAINVR